VANADDCTINLHYGRIDAIMYTRAEATDAMTDASDDTEWSTRLSNSAALTVSGTPAPIRYLYTIGEWPLPERTEVQVSGGRTAQTVPKHTITLDVDDTGDTNAALLASEQLTTKRRKVWFLIQGQLWGGNAGYEMDMTFLGRIVTRARTDKQIIQIQLKYEGAQGAPIASVVPILTPA
jgi:hypothetical protein